MIVKLPDGSVKEVKVNSEKIDDVLRSLSLNPVIFLVKKDGKFIPGDTVLTDKDTVELIRSTHTG